MIYNISNINWGVYCINIIENIQNTGNLKIYKKRFSNNR